MDLRRSYFTFCFVGLSLMAATGCLSSDSEGTVDTAATTFTIEGSTLEADADKILALETDDNTFTVESLDAGTFSLTLTTGNYAFALLNEDNQAIGLLAEDGVTVFELSEDLELGELTIDAETYAMTSAASLSAIPGLFFKTQTNDEPNYSDLVDPAADGVGDGDESRASSADSDGDGIPDAIDSDADDNGVPDNNDSGGKDLCHWALADSSESDLNKADLDEMAPLLDTVDCKVFDNLKLFVEGFSFDGDSFSFTDDHVITLELGDVDPSLIVNSVSVNLKQFDAKDAIVSAPAAGFTFTGTVPTAGDRWDLDVDSNGVVFEAYPATNPLGDLVYTIWIELPSGIDPIPGTYWSFLVTLSSGAVLEFTTKLHYVFNAPTLPFEVTDSITTSTLAYPIIAGDLGSTTNPIPVDSASDVRITTERPVAESLVGSPYICGMYFNAQLFYYDSAENLLNVTAVQSSLSPDTDVTTCTTTNHDTSPSYLTLDLSRATDIPTTYAGTAVASYQVDVTMASARGDNTAAIIHLVNQ